MTTSLTILINRELLQEIFAGARSLYPRETILLLRGKRKKSSITVTELIVPPLASYGQNFATIPLSMLPVDFSIIGTVHSHPTPDMTPSHTDLNHFFGTILMIAGYPFVDGKNIRAYNRSGETVSISITET